MGGSSGQVIGYRYFTNFLLFIGNPIENLIAINFDKRGWISGRRVPMGDNGQIINIEAPSLYGENEGGVAGTLSLKLGTNSQTPDSVYKKYMESLGLQASAYPYQSYISFSGGYLLQSLASQTEEQLQELADQYNNGIIPGRGFYVGNSGYMKEMLLWPKRTRVRNDGRRQWYEVREDGAVVCEIGTNDRIKEFTQQAKAEIKSTKWSAIDPRDGVYNSDRYLTQEFVYLFSTGMEIGAIGYVFAEINFSAPVYGGHFFISAKLDDFGTLTATNSEVVKLYDSGLVSEGTTYEWLVLIKDGSTSVKLMIDVYSSVPVMHKATVVFSFTSSRNTYDYQSTSHDINPIHKIREILTDDTAMNKPESSVNDVNFMRAADRIYDEGLGISWSITEKSCIDAINELCYHIEAGIRVNRQTGLYEMVLFRDNWFDESEIHTIAENKIKKGSMQYEITNADEVVNQLNVNFYDRANIKHSSFSISESGLIQTLGRVNAETVDFPYFMNMRNAEIVANWKLKILSTGVLKGSFSTGWREARKWNRYDLIRLPWSRRWAKPILVRIMNIKLGGPTSNEVSIEWVEVVPSTGMMNTTIVADDPVNTQPEAPKPCNAKVFELPYFEAVQAFGEREVGIELADNPEVGYLCAIAEKPQNNSLNAALYADAGSGFERVATVNYCETAYLDQSIDRMVSTFVVKNVGNIAYVRVGSQIFINDETMVYQSYDAETKVLTVKRGAFGIPQAHAANSILYFADDFIAVDKTLYVAGENIDARVLTTTPSGLLALGDAFNHEVKFNARAIRPYPPANVKINGEYWPTEIETDLVLTWVDRNRVQQTGGSILGYFDAGVTVESGMTYKLIVYAIDSSNVQAEFFNQNVGAVNTYTVNLSTAPAAAVKFRIVLKSVRGNYESYQTFDHTLNAAFTAPYNFNMEYFV